MLRYEHSDMQDLENKLKSAQSEKLTPSAREELLNVIRLLKDQESAITKQERMSEQLTETKKEVRGQAVQIAENTAKNVEQDEKDEEHDAKIAENAAKNAEQDEKDEEHDIKIAENAEKNVEQDEKDKEHDAKISDLSERIDAINLKVKISQMVSWIGGIVGFVGGILGFVAFLG